MALRCALLACLLAGLAAAGSAAAARVALLIGNSEYRNGAFNLRNPRNDARALAAALEPLGFSVDVQVDADMAEISAALERFGAAAKDAEMALFFFAGHGVQMDGENFLLSSEFARPTVEGVLGQSLPLGSIRALLDEAAPDLGVVVLDACRDNPFATRSLGSLGSRGLARSRFSSGTLIAYATDPGNVAYDGTGENSFFTEALLEYIASPSLEARLMFGRVRQQVALITGGSQVPWVEESVLGEYYFNDAPRETEADPEIERDIAAWRTASAVGDAAGYEAYLAAFPEGLFAVFAEERMTLMQAAAALPDADAGDFEITDADRERLTFALSTLGFLSRTRGQAEASDAELRAGVASYGRQMAGGPVEGFEPIYLDAAQVMVVLGSTTAQRIRTDMAALKSIELTLDMAGRAYGELQSLPASDEVSAALAQADEDVAAIGDYRDQVLERLDESRSYYAGLVERGREDFQPYLQRSMAALLEKSRSVPAFEARLFGDVDTFIRHASASAAEMPEGSYAWIADFLPQE